MAGGTANVKGLTLHQPWAWLIANGHKRLETRSWPTDYRGKLAIHAGRQLSRDDAEALRAFGVPVPPDAELPLGAVVAVVDLVHVRPLVDTAHDARGASVAMFDDATLAAFWQRGEAWTGAPFDDLWAFELANVIPLRPTPWRGSRLLWDVPRELLEELRAAFLATQGGVAA